MSVAARKVAPLDSIHEYIGVKIISHRIPLHIVSLRVENSQITPNPSKARWAAESGLRGRGVHKPGGVRTFFGFHKGSGLNFRFWSFRPKFYGYSRKLGSENSVPTSNLLLFGFSRKLAGHPGIIPLPPRHAQRQ